MILESQPHKDLVSTYRDGMPSVGHTTDHNVAVNDHDLQAWKVKTKRYFMANADHGWFNSYFTMIHWFGHSASVGTTVYKQLESTLEHIGNSTSDLQYTGMSCYGYKKSEALKLIASHFPGRIGISLKEFKVGFAALTDMWTEEHSSLKGFSKKATLRHYNDRYPSAKGIPKRPGFFDPLLAFADETQYKEIIASKNKSNTSQEVICDRWKLDKLYIPKNFKNKELIQNILNTYNYDYNDIVVEF